MTLSPKIIAQVAHFGRVTLTEVEVEEITGDINQVLNFAEFINKVDTQDIAPCINILPVFNVMREDAVGSSLEKTEVFQNTASEEESMFKVPRIL